MKAISTIELLIAILFFTLDRKVNFIFPLCWISVKTEILSSTSRIEVKPDQAKSSRFAKVDASSRK